MFNESILTLDQPRRTWPLALTAALHVALVGAYALMPEQIREVAEKAIRVEFQMQVPVAPPPPPPALPAAPAPAPKRTEAAQAPVLPVEPVTAQPDQVPQDLPVELPVAESSGELNLDPSQGVPSTGGGDGEGEGPFGDGAGETLEPAEPVILRVGGKVQRPIATFKPQPVYTEMARRIRLQGVVVLEAVIDRDGRVTNVKVLKGMGYGLTESATDAVKKWRFQPAKLGDENVAVYYELTINFQLN